MIVDVMDAARDDLTNALNACVTGPRRQGDLTGSRLRVVAFVLLLASVTLAGCSVQV